MPRGGHAERAMQGSWRQEYGAAHAGGPKAQQAGKLETRALFAGSQGGTVAPAGGNACAPRSVRLGLRPPAVPRPGWSGLGLMLCAPVPHSLCSNSLLRTHDAINVGRTLLPAAVLDPSGQASPAEGQPCRTAVARFTAA